MEFKIKGNWGVFDKLKNEELLTDLKAFSQHAFFFNDKYGPFTSESNPQERYIIEALDENQRFFKLYTFTDIDEYHHDLMVLKTVSGHFCVDKCYKAYDILFFPIHLPVLMNFHEKDDHGQTLLTISDLDNKALLQFRVTYNTEIYRCVHVDESLIINEIE